MTTKTAAQRKRTGARARRIKLRFVGISPLLVRAWHQSELAFAARSADKILSATALFEAAKYKDELGRECLPAAAIRRALLDAALYCGDVTKKCARSAFIVRGDLLPITSQKAMVFKVVMGCGGRTQYSAEYLRWSIPIEVEFDARVLSANQITALARLAGRGIGLGQWRPSQGGAYGRFSVSRSATTG